MPYFPYFVTLVNDFIHCSPCVQQQSPTLDGRHVCNSSSTELLHSVRFPPSPPGSSNVFSLLCWRRRRSYANSLSSHSAAAFPTINVTKRPRYFHSPSIYSILTWKWTLWKFWVCEEPHRYFQLKCHGSNNNTVLAVCCPSSDLKLLCSSWQWDAGVVAPVPVDLWGPEQGYTGGFYKGANEKEYNEKGAHTRGCLHKCPIWVQHEGKDSLQLLSDTYAVIRPCNLCVQWLATQIQQNILLHHPKCHCDHLQSHILSVVYTTLSFHH